MIELSFLGTPVVVIHGHCVDADADHFFRFPVGEDRLAFDFVRCGGGHDDRRPVFLDVCNRFWIEVVAMNVRDQDQIRLLSGAVVSVAPGVYLDDFAPELDLHASVRDRGSNSRGSEYESGEGEL